MFSQIDLTKPLKKNVIDRDRAKARARALFCVHYPKTIIKYLRQDERKNTKTFKQFKFEMVLFLSDPTYI